LSFQDSNILISTFFLGVVELALLDQFDPVEFQPTESHFGASFTKSKSEISSQRKIL